MSGKIKRKIFKLGRSHVLTLPPDWVRQIKTDKVLVLFDNVVLIMPEEYEGTVDKIMEDAIKSVVAAGRPKITHRKKATPI